MKTQNLIITLAGVAFTQLLTLNVSAKDIIKTDLDRVYNAGTQNTAPATQINLQAGVYAIGDDDNETYGTHYLIVDKYINDDDKILAIMVNQSQYNNGEKTVGKFFIGKKIKNGSSLMLSPIYIDINGNLAIQSEMSNRAEVVEISVRNQLGDHRYPYLVQGHHGALGGHLLGMRAKSRQAPNLVAWPTNNIFRGDSRHDNLVVTGSTVAIHNGKNLDQRFELLPLNGDLGKFAQMVRTELDTMGEYMISSTQVQKLAFFMKNTRNEEIFIVANPGARVGEFIMEFYGPKRRSFMDYLFPGLTDVNGG